jgi:beta-lactamase regulating signal transducer with metallopeptidase domain
MIDPLAGLSASLFQVVLPGLWRASWHASVLALVVLGVQKLLQGRIGGRGRYALWAIVLIRLMLPALPASRWSVFNLASRMFPDSSTARLMQGPAPTNRIATAEVEHISNALPAQGIPLQQPDSIPERLYLCRYEILGGIWLAGMGLLALRVAVGSRRLRRQLRVLKPVDGDEIIGAASRAASLLSLRRPPLLCGELIQTPAVVGFFRPVIVLPLRVLRDCAPHEIELILLHELAHIKRRDVAANWLVTLVSLLHWFNPFVWLIAARIRSDRELACDEMVLSLASPHAQNPQSYGRTLLRLAELLTDRAALVHPPQAVGILEPTHVMQRRMRMIAQFNPDRASRRWIWLAMPLLLIALTALTDAVKGQSPAPASRSASATQPAPDVGALTEQDAKAALAKVLPQVRLNAVSLSDAMDYMRSAMQVNLVVQWRALESAGIDRSTPVTVELRNIPAGNVLRHILQDVGGSSVRLGMMIDGGTLIVSTEEDVSMHVKTVLYDVSDLIVAPDGKLFSTDEAREKKVSDLVRLIQDSISSETWKDNGGTIGYIREFNNKLVIVQSTENHRQIALLLARLREKPSTEPKPLEN